MLNFLFKMDLLNNSFDEEIQECVFQLFPVALLYYVSSQCHDSLNVFYEIGTFEILI